MATKREASSAASLMGKRRWKGVTAEERSAYAARISALRGPDQLGAAAKRTDVPRCPCGEMTLKRAKARAHKCEAPKPAGRKK